MSDTNYHLWCYVEGDETVFDLVFDVIASSTISISKLRQTIKEKRSNILQGIDAASLTLSKVRYF
jgi:hypothetical protein